jgi:hypothetical protein
MTIKQRGKKFIVTDLTGKKTLGTHDTRKEAAKQLKAIEANKRRRSK